jgi:hypothetical protein
MSNHYRSNGRRRSFLKRSLAAGALIGLGMSHTEALRMAAAAANIRARDWHTTPRNDDQTFETAAGSRDGDLRLLSNADGSFQSQRTFVSAVHQAASPYNMVGMQWVADVPPGTSLAVEVRGSADGANWTAWMPVGHLLEQRESATNRAPDVTFADAVDLSRAQAMQYRLILGTSNPAISPVVRQVTATQIDALDAPTLQELDARGQATPFMLESQQLRGLDLDMEMESSKALGQTDPPFTRFVPRDGPLGWGPGEVPPELYWPPLSGVYPYQFVTIHHTAGVNNPEKPLATVRAIWYFHAITLGWGDIGYHFLVDQFGNVYEGRDGGDSTEGGHVFRYNHYNCGVSLLGQFQPGAPDVPPGGEPSRAALLSATIMAALEAAYHKFDPLQQHTYPKPPDSCRPQLTNYRVSGHRDWGRDGSCVATACPGDNLYKHLPTIRRRASRLAPIMARSPLIRILGEL